MIHRKNENTPLSYLRKFEEGKSKEGAETPSQGSDSQQPDHKKPRRDNRRLVVAIDTMCEF